MIFLINCAKCGVLGEGAGPFGGGLPEAESLGEVAARAASEVMVDVLR